MLLKKSAACHRRGEFITLLGGAAMSAAWSFATHAQKRMRIGVLQTLTAAEFDGPAIGGP
jgi:hypothetical protein